MHPFELIRATDVTQAIQGAAKNSTAQQGAQIRFVGGGTTLIDLMKLNVEQPQTVIDINGLPLNQVEALPDGGLKIGAVVRNSDLAYHPAVDRDYPVLSQALLSGASAQNFSAGETRASRGALRIRSERYCKSVDCCGSVVQTWT